MKNREAIWFECKIRYEKVMEDGMRKKVTEQYVVEALSFAEAEKRFIEEMTPYVRGEYEVTDVRKAQYRTVLLSDADVADRWYKAKLQFITIDERTEKEKRSAYTCLVQATSFDAAVKNINEAMDGTMIDYEKSNIQETKIVDVFVIEQVHGTND